MGTFYLYIKFENIWRNMDIDKFISDLR